MDPIKQGVVQQGTITGSRLNLHVNDGSGKLSDIQVRAYGSFTGFIMSLFGKAIKLEVMRDDTHKNQTFYVNKRSLGLRVIENACKSGSQFDVKNVSSKIKDQAFAILFQNSPPDSHKKFNAKALEQVANEEIRKLISPEQPKNPSKEDPSSATPLETNPQVAKTEHDTPVQEPAKTQQVKSEIPKTVKDNTPAKEPVKTEYAKPEILKTAGDTTSAKEPDKTQQAVPQIPKAKKDTPAKEPDKTEQTSPKIPKTAGDTTVPDQTKASEVNPGLQKADQPSDPSELTKELYPMIEYLKANNNNASTFQDELDDGTKLLYSASYEEATHSIIVKCLDPRTYLTKYNILYKIEIDVTEDSVTRLPLNALPDDLDEEQIVHLKSFNETYKWIVKEVLKNRSDA